VYIIECNPLDQLTGASLFNYFEDWEIVTGRAKFEFRVVEANWKGLESHHNVTLATFSPEITRAKFLQQKRNEEKEKEKCRIM